MRFDLTDLRLFLNVVEAASITGGAERAGLALASASARVRGMEDVLGVPLLERGGRGVRPTPAGRTLAHHARIVLRQVERMRGELADFARGLKGHVRLLCNTAALMEFLPDALAGFLAAHPGIEIDLEERLSAEIVPAILDGAADMGIVADSVDTAGLLAVPFRRDRLVLVTADGHPFAARGRIGFAETLDESFVGLVEGSALQGHLAGHAARAGRRMAFRVRLRGFEAVGRMVERGVGIAVMPETAARRCQETMRLAVVPLAESWADRNLMLVVRDLDRLPVHARRLFDALAAGGPGGGPGGGAADGSAQPPPGRGS